MIPAQPRSTAPDFAAPFNREQWGEQLGEPSAYYQKLYPWCIVCQIPPMRSQIICRFRKRSEAEAHLRVLRQLTPDTRYLILLDPGEIMPNSVNAPEQPTRPVHRAE